MQASDNRAVLSVTVDTGAATIAIASVVMQPPDAGPALARTADDRQLETASGMLPHVPVHEARAGTSVAALDAASPDPASASDIAAAAIREAASPTSLFGSFFLGEDEFALPASSIREVVNYPDKVTAMPLSPPFLEGVFTLRGNVIPVLNLGRIFDPHAPAADATNRIAIIDHQHIQIGIAFHSTGEILRVRQQQRSMLHYRDAASHGVICGTIRLDDGARLLQILDPAALISIENVPQVHAMQSAGRQVETNQFHQQAERRQCVAFKVGGSAFAFEMHAIREIINVPELKSSVLTSKLCIGRINLRGQTVAVVDFASLLGVQGGAAGVAAGSMAERRIVIARIGDASIGLLVDSVDNIFSFFPGDVLPIPLLSKTRAGMFGGCIDKEGIGAILFLDHQEIFSSAEILELTRGHAELYQQENAGAVAAALPGTGKSGDNLARKVYITFSIGTTYALEIRKIREIIDFSGDMIEPPGMPPFVAGILNLRRQLVTIIDLRALYGMVPLADKTAAKIVVIERGDERYGLMVDAVDNIVTVAGTDRMPTPGLMRGKPGTDLRSEMQEVIELTGAHSRRQTLSVFEVDVFLERLARGMSTC